MTRSLRRKTACSRFYEAEDQYIGRLLGVAYAEPFRSHSPLLVRDPTLFVAGIHG